MEKHLEALANASLETNNNLNLCAWYESYALPLHLFNFEDDKYKKAIKKRNKNRKHIINYMEPTLLTVEGVRGEFTKVKRWETHIKLWNKYLDPVAKPELRSHHLAESLEALSKSDIDTALEHIKSLPVDYLVHNEFWGKVILFIVSALSGQQQQARAITQELYNMAQSEHNKAILSSLLPALINKYLDDEYMPWQMRSLTVEWEGKTYHCIPTYIHNLEAYGGEEYIKQTPRKERAQVQRTHDVGYVYAYDSYGNKGQNALTLSTNVAIGAANAVGKVAAGAVLATVGGALYLALAGKFKAYSYCNSENTIAFKRSIEMPVNSCGYIVSEDADVVKPLTTEGAKETIYHHDAFLNFADGVVYRGRKGNQIPNAEGLMDLIIKRISQNGD